MKLKTLHLTLNKKWFDLIASGVKTEEYREPKPYWLRRLCHHELRRTCTINNNTCCPLCFHAIGDEWCFEDFDLVEFRNGYHKDAPTMIFGIDSITYGEGRSDCGAETGKMYIIIKFKNRIK